MNLPLTVKNFDKRDGTGSKVYKAPVDTVCYVDGKVQVITDLTGAEVVSTRQLYVDGSIDISELDSVIFESKELPVKGVQPFYRKGVPDLKVVYV